MLIIGNLGKDAKFNDLISQFAQVIGKLRATSIDVQKYFVNTINDSILSGKSVLIENKGYKYLNHKVLGFTGADPPDYVRAMRLSSLDFGLAREAALKSTGASGPRRARGQLLGNWVQIWRKAGIALHYTRILSALEAKMVQAGQDQKADCRKVCELKIKEEFAKKSVIKNAKDSVAAVSEQADACVAGKWNGAPKSCFFKKPNEAAMKEDAKKQATLIMASEAKATPAATMVKEAETKAELETNAELAAK